MNRQNVLEPTASCCRSIIFGALVLMPVIESALNGTATDRKRTKNREWEQRKWEKNERKEYHTFHSKWTNVLFVEFRWFAPPVVSWASVEKVFRIKFAKTKSITIHAVRLKYKHQQHWPGRCEVIFGCLNFTFSIVWINRVIKQIKNGTKAFRKDLDERPNKKNRSQKFLLFWRSFRRSFIFLNFFVIMTKAAFRKAYVKLTTVAARSVLFVRHVNDRAYAFEISLRMNFNK